MRRSKRLLALNLSAWQAVALISGTHLQIGKGKNHRHCGNIALSATKGRDVIKEEPVFDSISDVRSNRSPGSQHGDAQTNRARQCCTGMRENQFAGVPLKKSCLGNVAGHAAKRRRAWASASCLPMRERWSSCASARRRTLG